MTTATQLFTRIADKLGIAWYFVDDEQAFLIFEFEWGKQFIVNTNLGLITSTDERIALDKAYQYLLLKD